MSHSYDEVLIVHHWMDTLFWLRTRRHSWFRLPCGQTMIGLQAGDRSLMRVHRLIRTFYDKVVAFLNMMMKDGPFTGRGKKAAGTLELGNLLPSSNPNLLRISVGLTSFMSIIRGGYLRGGLYCREMSKRRGPFARLSIWPRDTEPQNGAIPCSSWLP